jgi:hypothetical protein
MSEFSSTPATPADVLDRHIADLKALLEAEDARLNRARMDLAKCQAARNAAQAQLVTFTAQAEAMKAGTGNTVRIAEHATPAEIPGAGFVRYW